MAADKSGVFLTAERQREAKRRASLKRGVSSDSAATVRRILAALFPEQRAFVLDPSYLKAALCSRQSGKTFAIGCLLLLKALQHPSSTCKYVQKIRDDAKRVLWLDQTSGLPALCRRFGIAADLNASDLRLTLPNGSQVQLHGVMDRSGADNLRGVPLRLAVVDEAQAVEDGALDYLVGQVLVPTCVDHGGQVVLIGTPGPAPVGRFHDATATGPGEGSWSAHRWGRLDNAFFPEALRMVRDGEAPDVRSANAMIVARSARLLGWSDTRPEFRREYLGQWVYASSEFLYQYDPGRNGYDGELPPGHEWSHVLGGDLGFERDPSAFVVWAFSPTCDTVYEVESWKGETKTLYDVYREVGRLVSLYRPVATAIDESPPGPLVCRSLEQLYGLRLELSQKGYRSGGTAGKREEIAMENGFLHDGQVKVVRGGALEAEWLRVRRDRRTGIEAPGSDNHCSDAGHYGLQRVLGGLWRFSPVAPRPRAAERLLRELEEHRERENARTGDPDGHWWDRLAPEDDGGDDGWA